MQSKMSLDRDHFNALNSTRPALHSDFEPDKSRILRRASHLPCQQCVHSLVYAVIHRVFKVAADKFSKAGVKQSSWSRCAGCANERPSGCQPSRSTSSSFCKRYCGRAVVASCLKHVATTLRGRDPALLQTTNRRPAGATSNTKSESNCFRSATRNSRHGHKATRCRQVR